MFEIIVTILDDYLVHCNQFENHDNMDHFGSYITMHPLFSFLYSEIIT